VQRHGEYAAALDRIATEARDKILSGERRQGIKSSF
jgi:hypothetical protein